MTQPFWEELQQGATRGWQAVQAHAHALVSAVAEGPQRYTQHVSLFVASMSATRQSLDRQRALLPHLSHDPDSQALRARHMELEQRYDALATGFLSDTQPAPQQPSLGWSPVVLVGGLAVGAAGVAWAASAYQYAVSLREQTALAEQELQARVQASREGRTLQAHTLPSLSAPRAGLGLLGLGALALGGLVLWKARS